MRQVIQLMNIINVKFESSGVWLHDDDHETIYNIDDPRLTFVYKMVTAFKQMDSSKCGARVRTLTDNTANALHVKWSCLNDL